MLRKQVGEYLVGIRKYDTVEIGDEFHRRKVPMAFFYPSETWEKECPYKDAAFQRAAPYVLWRESGYFGKCKEISCDSLQPWTKRF